MSIEPKGFGRGPVPSQDCAWGTARRLFDKADDQLFPQRLLRYEHQRLWQPHRLRRVTDALLQFSKSRGNDLSAPMPDSGFAGLKAGDRWCLCAPRWQEARGAAKAPRVVLRASGGPGNEKTTCF